MNAGQLDLFTIPADPMARAKDPATSKAAARTVDTNARETECVEALRRLVCASDCHDIQRVLAEYGIQRDRNCIARRLTSLERKGLVRRSGVKQGPRGAHTTLWRLA